MQADTLTIKRLQLRTYPECSVQDVLGALDKAAIPHNPEWVFIRRLVLRGPLAAFAELFSDELRSALTHANWGGNPGEAANSLVWFADAHDYVLQTSLALGRSQSTWWYEPEQDCSGGAKIARLWTDHLRLLPHVFRALLERHALGRTLAMIPADNCERLLAAWCEQARQTVPPAEIQQAEPEPPTIPPGARQDPLARFAARHIEHTLTPQLRLVVAMLGQRWQPGQTADDTDWGGFVARLTAHTAALPPVAKASPGDRTPGPVVSRQKEASAGDVDTREHPAPAHSLPGSVAIKPGQTVPDTQPLSFDTQWGGLWFLLNAIKHSGDGEALGEVNGWLTLARCADLLAIPEKDPVIPFLVERSGFSDWTELQDAGHHEHLLDALQLEPLLHDYAHAELEVASFRKAATVEMTDLDLTVTFPMEALDLTIRLCGLDLDPGWVPSLGLEVRFIYTNAELAG